MKYLLAIIASITLFSCTKEQPLESDKPEEIQVRVYATHAGDSTIVASTNIIQVYVK